MLLAKLQNLYRMHNNRMRNPSATAPKPRYSHNRGQVIEIGEQGIEIKKHYRRRL